MTSDSVDARKAELRRWARHNLGLIEDQSGKSFRIVEKIRQFLFSYIESYQAGTVGLFLSLPGEPDLRDLLSLQFQPELEPITWTVPRLVGDDLTFYVPDQKVGGGYFLDKNQYGIEEPIPEKALEVTPSQLDIVFVPGLAFDRSLNRLGRGKGYYDRFLKKCSALRVGVLFQGQISQESIPILDHDEPLDWLITENEIFKSMQKKRIA